MALHTSKRILLTGGAGNLNQYLFEQFLNDWQDSLCRDKHLAPIKDNIIHLLDNHQMEPLLHDSTFPLYVENDETRYLVCPEFTPCVA